jgi:aspartate/methionine/tyrosine aminotransferase
VAPVHSRRLPASAEPNAWFTRLAARRASGARLLDLTEANPTRVGLDPLSDDLLAALADPASKAYEPDPRGLLAAREAVAAYYARRGETLSAEQVILTSGTSESFAHLLRLLVDPGGSVLVPSPGYPLFEPIAAVEGVRAVGYRLECGSQWRLDLPSVERGLAAGGRAVVVVHPNPPAGRALTPDEWEAIETMCAARGAALVVDEVFSDYAWDPAAPRFASRVGARSVPTFVLNGLSKTCGLPQLKLGWIVVAGPEDDIRTAIAGLEWLADLFLSVGTPVQQALPRILSECGGFQSRMRARLRANLASLDARTAREPRVARLPAEGGWSCALQLPGTRDDERWALDLLERDVVVHPGHFYELEVGACVVPGLIAPPEVFTAALDRIAETIAAG